MASITYKKFLALKNLLQYKESQKVADLKKDLSFLAHKLTSKEFNRLLNLFAEQEETLINELAKHKKVFIRLDDNISKTLNFDLPNDIFSDLE